MKKNLKKYLISTLSLLLILSNFSFATSFLYCTMKAEVVQTCCCSHKPVNNTGGLSLSQYHKSCCNLETRELANSNILNTVKSELPNKILTLVNTFAVVDPDACLSALQCTFITSCLLHQQIPKTDIPISNSSLLI